MRRDTVVWPLMVAVLAMVLFAGCGKSKKAERTQQQAQQQSAMSGPGAVPMPRQLPDGSYAPPMPLGAPGQMPGAYGQQYGAYGQQQMQLAPTQPTEPEEAEPSGPSYQERYKQGELTAEELRQEHELQKVERELGYPAGP